MTWQAVQSGEYWAVASDGVVIADGLSKENAHLMAAAPEMREALLEVSDVVLCLDCSINRDRVDAAIQKARGQS